MANRFTTSVAAIALIAGTSFAYAQGTGTSRDSGGAAAQQSAPSSEHGGAPATQERGGAGQMNHNGMQSGPKAEGGQRAQGESKSGATQEKSAQDNSTRGERSKSMSSESENGKNSKEMKAEGREDHGKTKAEGREERGNMKAEGREDRGNMKSEGREGRNDNMKAEGREGRSGADGKTVGQAGAGAKLSSEQRTKITTVIRSQHVAPVTNVNFSVSIGTRVPRDVSFHPLPTEIVTVYPDWRGFEFIMVRDQIVVIDPQTLEIVAVLDA